MVLVLVSGLVAAAAYLYGVHVGLREGRKKGRRAAERELAHRLEMGAL